MTEEFHDKKKPLLNLKLSLLSGIKNVEWDFSLEKCSSFFLGGGGWDLRCQSFC